MCAGRCKAASVSLLRERIAALAGELPVRQRPLPRLGQRDQGGAAESEFALPAPDGDHARQ